MRTQLTSSLALLIGATFPAQAIDVATDIAPIQSLAAAVIGDQGEVSAIIAAGASPHHFSLKPSDAQTITDADLALVTDGNLAPAYVKAVNTLNTNGKQIVLTEQDGITLYDFREAARFVEEKHDHSEHGHDEEGHEGHDHAKEHDGHNHDEEHAGHGHDHDKKEHGEHDHSEAGHDEHAGGHSGGHHGHDHGPGAVDPHIWLDPQNAVAIVNLIAEHAAEIDPDNASVYNENAANAVARIEETGAQAQEIFADIEPSFLQFHDSLQYFEKAFGIQSLGSISLGDSAKPSPARVSKIIELVNELSPVCAVIEPQYNTAIVDTVAGDDIKRVTIDPLGSDLELGADLYPNLILGMAETLSTCAE